MNTMSDDQIWDMLSQLSLKEKIMQLEGGLAYEVTDFVLNVNQPVAARLKMEVLTSATERDN